MPDLLIKKETPARIGFRMANGGGIIFYGSLTVFFLTLAAYGGLFFMNRSQTKTRLEIEDQVKAKEEELRPELVNQIFLLETRLKNLQGLLSEHNFSSNVFKFLEENTTLRVRFINFDFDADKRKLDMTGEAASYSALTEQILLLERNPLVEKVEFGGLVLGGNNLVNFRLNLIFKPALLQRPGA